MSEKQVYSIKEFCEAYGISRSTFYRLKAEGGLPVLTVIGGVDKITVEDAKSWAEKLKRK